MEDKERIGKETCGIVKREYRRKREKVGVRM